jgi:hypothetical protein
MMLPMKKEKMNELKLFTYDSHPPSTLFLLQYLSFATHLEILERTTRTKIHDTGCCKSPIRFKKPVYLAKPAENLPK